jgi:transcriptional regulator with XRE-family HTH domain
MVNNNIKFCRQTLEMTQSELGYIFGVTKQTVSNWENGNDVMPLRKLIKFCNKYEFGIDYVLGLTRKNNYNRPLNLDLKRLGLNLRKKRKELKLTQQELANECSISQTTYSNYELGINLITTLTLYIICKNHNWTMNELINDTI